MTTTYAIKLYDPNANYIRDLIGFTSLDITKTENSAGALTLLLPTSYDLSDFAKDAQLYVYRSVDGLPPKLLFGTFFFVRYRQYAIADTGRSQLHIRAFDATSLLSRRTVAYRAGTAQASKSGAAETVIKAVVTENFISRSAIATLAVQTDGGQGPTITIAMANRNVLQTLQDIANASSQGGTYLGFDIVATGVNTLEFRTYTNQRGADRSSSSAKPVFISIQNRNLTNASLAYDDTSEVNVVNAFGQGEGSDRVTVNAIDSASQAASPYAQSELFVNGSNQTTTTQLQSMANASLRANREKKLFEGDLQQTASFRFGAEYDFGDKVTAQFLGQWFDSRISSVGLKVESGKETVSSKLRSVT
jgi:hypothetical protein